MSKGYEGAPQEYEGVPPEIVRLVRESHIIAFQAGLRGEAASTFRKSYIAATLTSQILPDMETAGERVSRS